MDHVKVTTDVHENGFTVFILNDGTRVKAREVASISSAPYVIVARGTPTPIKEAITYWSNLVCTEGSLEES